jgi:hypothetical protein
MGPRDIRIHIFQVCSRLAFMAAVFFDAAFHKSCLLFEKIFSATVSPTGFPFLFDDETPCRGFNLVLT